MKSQKVIATILAGLMAVMSFGGCRSSTNANSKGGSTGGATGAKTTLNYYYWGAGANSTDPMDKLTISVVKQFNSSNKDNATINLENVDLANYYTKLNSAIASGSGPDLFTCNCSEELGTYAKSDKCADLTSYLDKDAKWKSSFLAHDFDLLSWNNKVYGIPQCKSLVGLFYNKDIFTKYKLDPPKTYDDLKNVVSVLYKNGETPFSFGAKDGWTAALFEECVHNRIGGDAPIDNIVKGSGSFTDSSFVETQKCMDELKSLHAFPSNFMGVDNNAQIAMFKNGQAAMYVCGSWNIGPFYATDSKVANKVGVVPFPAFTNGKGDANEWLGQTDDNIAVSKDCKNIQAAVDFCKLWTSDEIQMRLNAETGKFVVTNVKVDSSKTYALSTELASKSSNMTKMFTFYDLALGQTVGNEWDTVVPSMLGGKDAMTALKALDKFKADNAK